MFAIWGALVVLLDACTAPDAARDDHPLSAERRAALTRELDAAIEKLTAAIQAAPRDDGNYSRRGDAYFFRGRFQEAVADYEKMVELKPELAASHWRRGIAYFYAEQYEQAAGQFELYHTVDDVDRENGIWRFFSQTKAAGKDKARAGLFKYRKDDREPFPSVYQLLTRDVTSAQILEQISAADIDAAERERRLFYAHLYIGLNHAIDGETEPAREHLRKAVANEWAPRGGFGPQYMWHVGRVQFDLLDAAKEQ